MGLKTQIQIETDMTFSIQRHAKSIGLILKTGRVLQHIDVYIQLIIVNQDLITGEVTFTDKKFILEKGRYNE